MELGKPMDELGTCWTGSFLGSRPDKGHRADKEKFQFS